MGNWQERIRQRLSAEQQQLKVQQEALILKAQQEKERQLERARQEQEKTEATEKQLLLILERLGARELLQQVKGEVWKVGDMQQVKNNKASMYVPQYVGYQLGYTYDVAEKWQKTYDAGISTQTGAHLYGILAEGYKIEPKGGSTSLSILVFRDVTNGSDWSNYVTVKDSTDNTFLDIDRYAYTSLRYKNKIYRGLFHGIDVNVPDAQQFIQDIVFESCLRRTRTHQLPLELKAQAEQEISRSVPLYKRMFR